MAAAAVVSAGIAGLAIVLSIIGLVSSAKASTKAQDARNDATNAQWKMSEHLEAIAAAQADAARAAGGSTPIGVGGKLSARLVPSGRHSYKLVVANVGTQALIIEAIEAGQEDILIGANDVIEAQLEPGEEVSLLAAITMGTEIPINVTLRWRDSDGESHERLQKVTLP